MDFYSGVDKIRLAGLAAFVGLEERRREKYSYGGWESRDCAALVLFRAHFENAPHEYLMDIVEQMEARLPPAHTEESRGEYENWFLSIANKARQEILGFNEHAGTKAN